VKEDAARGYATKPLNTVTLQQKSTESLFSPQPIDFRGAGLLMTPAKELPIVIEKSKEEVENRCLGARIKFT